MRIGVKIFNLIFFILFLISAFLQYNDPDPVIWITLYLVASVVCLLAVFGKFNLILTVFISGFYLGNAIFLFFDDTGVLTWITHHGAENISGTMDDSKPWIEETREFFGLLIMFSVLLCDVLIFKFSPKK